MRTSHITDKVLVGILNCFTAARKETGFTRIPVSFQDKPIVSHIKWKALAKSSRLI